MAFTVAAEPIKSTSRCGFEFSCLQTGCCGESNMCKAERAIADNLLFVLSDKHLDCAYQISFGNGKICSCPTRYAIHREYCV